MNRTLAERLVSFYSLKHGVDPHHECDQALHALIASTSAPRRANHWMLAQRETAALIWPDLFRQVQVRWTVVQREIGDSVGILLENYFHMF
ncbi:MAG: hypothetical protein KBF37_00550 [Saprospiraceae bacterium]|jgi:hypothetical protein|nr:hypothetical protein [Saprospiraceae bacterium]MBP9208784.1 hypothetical protein [Saprospiraceae bacterium]MBV6472346.1 hypothetical protein [Saprospiraceae bacterium]